MKPYGIEPKYNDDYVNSEVGRHRQAQSRIKKQGRRIGRHRDKNKLRKLFSLLLRGINL